MAVKKETLKKVGKVVGLISLGVVIGVVGTKAKQKKNSASQNIPDEPMPETIPEPIPVTPTESM